MPAQTVWFIRLSLIYLLVSAGFGSVLLAHKVWGFHPGVWAILPVHYEIAVWGWMVQFVMGTAYWMFPRHLTGQARGPKHLSRAMIVLYNGGVILVWGSSIFSNSPVPGPAGRICIALALGLFIFLLWPRIVSYRNE